MALETASWITELVTTNPVAGDPVGEGDDHLRMLKTVLQNSFPSSSTAAVIPNMSGNGGSILITDGTDSAWSSVIYIDTGNSRVGINNNAPTATLDVDGSAIFNESGAAVDFRIEGDTDANLFFVDGSTNRIGISTNTPAYKLDVDDDFRVLSQYATTTLFAQHSTGRVGMNTTTPGYTLDVKGWFRVSNTWGGSTLYADYNSGRVGIGTVSPAAGFDCTGSAIFNSNSGNSDFIIKSQYNPNMFFLDGSTDRIGIGTGSPSSRLHIDGVNGEAFRWSYNSVFGKLLVGTAGARIDVTGANSGFGMDFSMDDSIKMTILPDGNIGIGTTTPTSHLQIDGDITANAWGTTGIVFDSNAATFTDNNTAASGTATSAVFNSFGVPTLAATNASVTTTNAATVYIAGSPAAGTNQTITNPYALWVDAGETRFDGDVGIDGNTFYVDSVNNRVGIGTTSPSQLLELKVPSGSFYQLFDNSTTTLYIGINSSNAGLISVNTVHPLIFSTNSTERVRIGSTGNVGIGNSNPGAKLDVDGSAIFNESGAAVDFRIEGDTDQNLFFVDGSTDRVGIGTNAPGATLDVNGGDALIHTLTVGLGAGSVATNTAVGKDALYSNTTSSRNTAVGYESLKLTTGGNNTALGANALAQNTTGSENTAIGDTPLYNNVTGIRNTAVGYYSLLDNTTSDNTAVGHNSLKQTTTGTRNVAVGSASGQVGTTGQHNSYLGYAAGYANSTGSYNTGIGYEALNQNTAADNTAVGYSALRSNTTGTPNIAVGKDALYTNTTAADNIAIGNRALYSSNSSGNVAIGDQALEDLTTGSSNIAIGVSSQLENTTGINNVSMGLGSLQKNTTGGRNVAIGFYAQWDGSGQIGNVAVGEGSLQYATLGANYNVGVGYQAGEQVTDGAGNALLGWSAGTEITTGDYNVAIGTSALGSQTTPTGNIGIGRSAATTNLTSSGIVAIGEYALQYNTANYNTSVGNQALRYNSTGTPNVALGYQALYNNETGDNNVAMGHQALLNSGKVQTAGSFETNISYTIKSTGTTDFTLIGAADSNPGTVFTATGAGTGTGTATPNTDSNTAVGWKAGDSITTGSNLTVIGYDAEPSSATATNEITLGDANVTDFRLPGPDIFSSSTETVFNESGADKDFRVEGDTDANLFFVDASADRVGIGTATPSTKLHIQNTSTTQSPLADTFLTVENNSAAHIQILSSDSQYGALVFGSASNNKVGSINYYYNGGAPYARIYVNNSEKIRIQNDGNVGIGNSSPGAKLDVDGSAIFNESGADVDFRIEGDTDPDLFFVDASTDRVGIGTATPRSVLDIDYPNGGGVFLGRNSVSSGVLQSANSFFINIDANNLHADTQKFVIAKNRTGETGGTDLFTVLENNNVGIGTSSPGATLDVNGDVNVEGMITAKQQSLSGPGAVNVTDLITEITTTGTGDALTLANGTAGQMKIITYVAEGAGADTAVLTPTTLNGGTTITFNNLGDGATLVYGTSGWTVVGINGAVIA